MQEFRNFPFNDGHIESILIGVDTVKLAFHTWDDKQCNFIFRESFYLKNNSGISGDIGEVKIETLKKILHKSMIKYWRTIRKAQRRI